MSATTTDETTAPLTLTRLRLGLICAAVLLLGLVVGLFLPAPGGPADVVEVEGTIGSVSANAAYGSFVPTGENADLAEDGDAVGAVLANDTGEDIEAGDEFVGRWVPDERVLIVEKVSAP